MGATSVFLVRGALTAVIGPALSGVGVDLLDALPTDAEDASTLRMAWWSNEIDVTTVPYTMPAGLSETYDLLLVLRCMPADGDVTTSDARAEALELLDLVFDEVQANRRPLSGEAWDAVVTYGGHSFLSARSNNPPGFAAGFEVRIGVEATRCS